MASGSAFGPRHFGRPVQQLLTMLVIIGLTGAGAWVAFPRVEAVFLANLYLNAAIAFVFVVGVITCFWQVAVLWRTVSWISRFAIDSDTQDTPPRLLASLVTMLRGRGRQKYITSTAARSLLDSVASRIEEGRDISRYITNLLIFLGLLGTFWGLAITVPAVVDTIRALKPADGEAGVDIFARLMNGLENQLGGMGTAFSSSLLGLAGSLVVGLLEIFAGQGQNRFYRDLEEWLSSITRVSFAGDGEAAASGDGAVLAQIDGVLESLETAINGLAEGQAEGVQAMRSLAAGQSANADRIGQLAESLAQTEKNRARLEGQIEALHVAVNQLTEVMQAQQQALAELASAQPAAQPGGGAPAEAVAEQTAALKAIVEGQKEIVEQLRRSGEGANAEIKNRLRYIDSRLVRLIEELQEGRQTTTDLIRTDIGAIARLLRRAMRAPDEPAAPGGAQAPAGKARGG